MSTVASCSFFEALQKSQLIEPQKLNQLMKNYPGLTEDSSELATYLIGRGAITEFQSKFLMTGRYRGLTIGPYSILNRIGSGGMGIVYLAEHRKMGRKVALKVLMEDHIGDQLALERFYREARSVATLDHPNIVKAHDVNDYQGIHYLVMEYVNGTNLQKYLQKKGNIPWKTVMNIIVQVCRGLQHAHERNFVHRDIKPANLLIEKCGQVKILDLGLARSLEKKRDNLTADLSDGKDVQGSIDYVSPEQAFGKGGVDIRADIYSLGATAYTLLTGQPIVNGSPAQKLLQHQMKMPTPPCELQPGMPRAFSDIIMKMLAKKPEQRYQSPAAIVSALKQFLAPATSTLMHATIVESLEVVVDEAVVVTDDPPTVVENAARTSKVKKLSGKKFKKKKASSNNAKWAILTASILFIAGISWAGYAVLGKGKNSAADETVAKREVPTTTATPTNRAGSGERTGSPAGPSNTTIALKEGEKLPDIVGEDLENTNFRLSDYEGKVVLLDFWGFWCPHCVKMFSHEKNLVTQYKNRPFAFLGVNNDKDDQIIARGMQQHQLNWRSFRDKLPDGRQISKMFGVKGFPTLILMDQHGVVRKIWVGAPSDKELDSMIEALVKKAEKSGTS